MIVNVTYMEVTIYVFIMHMVYMTLFEQPCFNINFSLFHDWGMVSVKMLCIISLSNKFVEISLLNWNHVEVEILVLEVGLN